MATFYLCVFHSNATLSGASALIARCSGPNVLSFTKNSTYPLYSPLNSLRARPQLTQMNTTTVNGVTSIA